jgi:hypothetical protein
MLALLAARVLVHSSIQQWVRSLAQQLVHSSIQQLTHMAEYWDSIGGGHRIDSTVQSTNSVQELARHRYSSFGLRRNAIGELVLNLGHVGLQMKLTLSKWYQCLRKNYHMYWFVPCDNLSSLVRLHYFALLG